MENNDHKKSINKQKAAFAYLENIIIVESKYSDSAEKLRSFLLTIVIQLMEKSGAKPIKQKKVHEMSEEIMMKHRHKEE